MLSLRNAGIDKFTELTLQKDLYVYGAGSYIDKFCRRNKTCPFVDSIRFFVDSFRFGWEKEIEGRFIPVISLAEMISYIQKESIILIASSHYYVDIIAELDKIEELDGICAYILAFVEHDADEETIDRSFYEDSNGTTAIPPKIHYCWFGGKDMPSQQKRYVDGWHKLNPEYDIVRWDESNYDISKNASLLSAYNKGQWAFVSDYARIDILFEEGGIYLDTDVELIKPLNELRRFKGFIGRESRNLVASGLGMGSVRRHIILKKIMQKYEQLFLENGYFTSIPCPDIETEVLETCGLIRNNSFQELEDGFVVLPVSFLGGMNAGTREIVIKDNTIAIHHYGGLWMGDDVDYANKRFEKSKTIVSRMIHD